VTSQDIYNRGYNLMITALVLLPGLAFGSVVLNEADFNDKIDDFVLLGSGILILVWYFIGRNRFSRSIVPLGFAVLSIAGQIAGVLIEKDDKEAFGDNIGGMIIFVGVVALAFYQYWRAPKVDVWSARS
jgi:hypothetical protein